MVFDPKAESAQEIVKRLRDEEVGWLVTVHDGTPRPVPVWFLWDGGTSLLIYSPPKALKTRTAAEHPQAAFHFNSTPQGGEVAILYGRVATGIGVSPALENAAYMAKYAGPIAHLKEDNGMSPEAFNEEYSVPLVLTIDDARAW